MSTFLENRKHTKTDGDHKGKNGYVVKRKNLGSNLDWSQIIIVLGYGLMALWTTVGRSNLGTKMIKRTFESDTKVILEASKNYSCNG